MRTVIIIGAIISLAVPACDVGGSGSPTIDSSVDAPASSIDAPPGVGSLAIMFTPTPTAGGGQYAPRNIDAVWIQGPTGTFIKTVGRWAGVRKTHLVAWTAAAGGTDADAVSGATQTTYARLSLTWDLKNKQAATVPDGTYTVRMESTDLNATTAGQNNQGTFTFVKGPTAQMQTGLSNGGFTNVAISFTP